MEGDADSGDHEDVIEAQSKNKFRSFDSIDVKQFMHHRPR